VAASYAFPVQYRCARHRRRTGNRRRLGSSYVRLRCHHRKDSLADASAYIPAGVPDYVSSEREAVHSYACGNWRRKLVHTDSVGVGSGDSPAKVWQRRARLRAASEYHQLIVGSGTAEIVAQAGACHRYLFDRELTDLAAIVVRPSKFSPIICQRRWPQAPEFRLSPASNAPPELHCKIAGPNAEVDLLISCQAQPPDSAGQGKAFCRRQT
jgi:hypothetical protein